MSLREGSARITPSSGGEGLHPLVEKVSIQEQCTTLAAGVDWSCDPVAALKGKHPECGLTVGEGEGGGGGGGGVSERGEVRQSGGSVGEGTAGSGTAAPLSLQC